MEAPAFQFRPMTEEDGEAISEWRYPPPYDLYRWPSWQTMKAQGREFGDPDIRSRQYNAVCDGSGRLIGYAQFFPLEGAVRLGLGLHPDCCGKGLGAAFARAIASEAASQYPGAQIDLEVEKWNERAIRAYRKAGFTAADEYTRRAAHGQVSVFCMVFDNVISLENLS